jgi:thiol-disulfide isomerase/thioredoxin
MRWVLWLGILALILTACAPVATPDAAAPEEQEVAEGADGGGSVVLLPEEEPPARAELEFTTDFGRHIVPYSEIISGGPPKDGIPAIDEPRFVSLDEATEWLDEREPVIVVEAGGEARAYPMQILTWHEIVNDTLGDVPVVVTFCPLCYTGIAFERTFDGQVLDFGTTGRLRNSNLIMYDRQTESWWQQATGEAIVGTFAGRQLTFLPAMVVSWADFQASYPDGTVLSRETGHSRRYGQNPYPGYDDVDGFPFLFDGQAEDGLLPPLARVYGIELNGEAVAYPYVTLQELHVANDTVAGADVVVLWAPGTASALDAGTIAAGRDDGAINAFSRQLDGRTLTFVFDGERIVDEQTGSAWDALGHAVSGSLAGSQLEAVVGVNHFWFSWAAFMPETRVYGVEGGATEPAPSPAPAGSQTEVSALPAEIEIEVYQGGDVLGGERVLFSDVVAQGRPVVLNMWAGLCPICRNEMPELQAAHERYADEVLLFGLDVGPFVGLGSTDDGLALLDDLGITFPAGTTREAAVIRDYRVLGTPATYFIAPDGEVIQQWNGFMTGDQLEANIEALIEASRDL